MSTKKFIAVALASIALFIEPSLAAPLSTFDDGTTQGWTPHGGDIQPGTPFGGTLQVVNNGHPGFALAAFDNIAGGSELWISAPSNYLGNLSVYSRITWDELLPVNPNAVTEIALVSWSQQSALLMVNLPSPGAGWRSRSVELLQTQWTIFGAASFLSILNSVEGLYINLEASNNLSIEATVDNIALVPVSEPALPIMLLVGLAPVLFTARRRSQKVLLGANEHSGDA